VPGDAVEPAGHAEPAVAEPPPRGERLGEGLGGELGRRLRVQGPPGEEPQEGLGVALVQGAEGLGLVPRQDDELDVVQLLVQGRLLGSRVPVSLPMMPLPPSGVTADPR
jgi:hypothetical protein